MNVRLDPAAREDIVYAVEWYAQRDRKAARRFLAAVDAEMIEITEFPTARLVWKHGWEPKISSAFCYTDFPM